MEKIKEYTEDLSFEEFEKDKKTIDAVIRNFEIIGEAAGNVPEEIYELYKLYGLNQTPPRHFPRLIYAHNF
ncbi:MAG: HepT-like ribonuclease domain-containing protein [Patescibacteria group bacterium]